MRKILKKMNYNLVNLNKNSFIYFFEKLNKNFKWLVLIIL